MDGSRQFFRQDATRQRESLPQGSALKTAHNMLFIFVFSIPLISSGFYVKYCSYSFFEHGFR